MASNKEKRKRVRSVLSLMWDQYQHMYQARATNQQDSINFLLIVVSFLPLISLELYTNFSFYFPFLVPVFFQLIALIVLLKKFFIPRANVPWFSVDELTKILELEDCSEQILAHIKAHENLTNDDRINYGEIIKNSVKIVILSIYSFLVASAFYFIKEEVSLYLIIVILAIGCILIWWYYQKYQTSSYDEYYKSNITAITKWINKK